MTPTRDQPPGHLPPELVEVGTSLSHPVRLKVIEALLTSSGLRFTDLIEITGKKPGALSPHLKQLQRGGIVRKVSEVHEQSLREYYALAPFGQRLLTQVLQAFVPLVSIRDQKDTATHTVLRLEPGELPEETNDAASIRYTIVAE